MRGWIVVEMYSPERKSHVLRSIATEYKRLHGILNGMCSCSYKVVNHEGAFDELREIRPPDHIYKTKKEADALVIKKLTAQKVMLREQLRNVSSNLVAVESGDL